MTADYDPEKVGARCSVCPLREQGAKPIRPMWARGLSAWAGGRPPSTWDIRPIVLVGEAPGMHEVKKGEPFVGPSGVKLDELLWNAGMKRSELLLVTNTLLCRPEVPDASGRRRYDVKNWMAWWRRENAARRKLKRPEMPSPFKCCYPRLKAELDAATQFVETQMPHGMNLVIMPLGNFALAAVQGQPGKAQGIMKYRGSVIMEDGQ